MRINGRDIGLRYLPYIIAEISCNHNGSVELAKELVDAAYEIGADAVKIQCYTAESICAKGAYTITHGIWKDRDLFELYKQAETPPKMAKEIIEYARDKRITCFSSVFDFETVDFLLDLGVPAFKIASFELVDLPLIQRVALTGLPTIISTGMGTVEEIKDAMNRHRQFDGGELGLLHCISEYPASPGEANLPFLGTLSTLLGGNHVVGLSDHTVGIGVATAAVALGATIIEKHLTVDRNNGSADAAFSMEPDEFHAMIMAISDTYHACRPVIPPKRPSNVEFRKSLFVVKHIAAGEAFSTDNVRPLRPHAGLSPKVYHAVLAGVANQDLEAGTPLQPSMVSTLC